MADARPAVLQSYPHQPQQWVPNPAPIAASAAQFRPLRPMPYAASSNRPPVAMLGYQQLPSAAEADIGSWIHVDQVGYVWQPKHLPPQQPLPPGYVQPPPPPPQQALPPWLLPPPVVGPIPIRRRQAGASSFGSDISATTQTSPGASPRSAQQTLTAQAAAMAPQGAQQPFPELTAQEAAMAPRCNRWARRSASPAGQ